MVGDKGHTYDRLRMRPHRLLSHAPPESGGVLRSVGIWVLFKETGYIYWWSKIDDMLTHLSMY